jgi:hypothetical protein
VTGTSARTVSDATPELLDLAAAVCGPDAQSKLVLADAEHFTTELLDQLHQDSRFDLLVPMPLTAYLRRRLQRPLARRHVCFSFAVKAKD